jgi:hypothetical protein
MPTTRIRPALAGCLLTAAPLAAGAATAGAATRTVAPEGRTWASFAYDPPLHKAVLFGGSTETTDPSATWIWNGTSWRQAS